MYVDLSWFIWHSPAIDDGAIHALLPKKYPNMRTLQLGRGATTPSVPRDVVNLSIGDLRVVIAAFPNLTALFVPFSLRPGDEALQTIAAIGLPLLGLVTYLDGCIDGKAMANLLISCRNLQVRLRVLMTTAIISYDQNINILLLRQHMYQKQVYNIHTYNIYIHMYMYE